MNLNMSEKQRESSRILAQGNKQIFKGNFRGAISTFDKAIEIDPKCLLAFQGRAFCKTILIEDIPTETHQNQLESIVSDLITAAPLIRDILIEDFGQKNP